MSGSEMSETSLYI